MKYIVITLMLGVLWAFINVYQVELELYDTGLERVEYALEHAVHDVGLNVDKSALTQGKVLYLEAGADDILVDTLRKNISINTNMEPEDSVLIKDKFTILDRQFIDHDYINPLTGTIITFPFEYKYSDGTNEFNRIIFGPSVVYIVETTFYGEQEPHQFVTIQEYKM
jgi:hypothetical protein